MARVALLACTGLAAALTYENPVFSVNSPDPGVLLYDGTYYAVTTSGDDANAFPIYMSTNLVNWTQTGYVFPAGAAGRPAWAVSDYWAPELHVVGANVIAYFAARHSDGQLSVGAAVASSPVGPFTDVGAPLIHQSDMGHIDPSFFHDAATGLQYLLWKEDGNAIGKPTPIFQAQLAANGTTVVSGWTQLITNDQSWESFLVEAPWMLAYGGSYVLFYSGNGAANYAVGAALSSSINGPFVKLHGPILHSASGDPGLVGPGHCSVLVLPDGTTTIFYHTWKNVPPVSNDDPRYFSMDVVTWSGSTPSVRNGNPSETEQPVP